MNQFFAGPFEHSTPQACIADLTPPTFAGIASLLPQGDGSLLASWLAATDSSPPINYEIFIQPDSASGLFSTSNLVAISRQLSVRIFTLANGNPLDNGNTYYVGVRARDAMGNIETNTVSLSAVSSGVSNRSSVYKIHRAFSLSASNMLSAGFWVTEDEDVMLTGLGTASYTIYDKDGNTIGITESGISADGQGIYRITPVLATAIQDLTHYLAQITIIVNGQPILNYKALALGE